MAVGVSVGVSVGVGVLVGSRVAVGEGIASVDACAAWVKAIAVWTAFSEGAPVQPANNITIMNRANQNRFMTPPLESFDWGSR